MTTQAKTAKRLEDAVNGSVREDTDIRAPEDDAGVVVPVRFDMDEYERVSKFAEGEGVALSALIRNAVVKKVDDELKLTDLRKLWAEDAKWIREHGPPPSLWESPNNEDDTDEWVWEWPE